MRGICRVRIELRRVKKMGNKAAFGPSLTQFIPRNEAA